jgi:hypothetical protein
MFYFLTCWGKLFGDIVRGHYGLKKSVHGGVKDNKKVDEIHICVGLFFIFQEMTRLTCRTPL